MKKLVAITALLCGWAGIAHAAGMEITEWEYKGTPGEFAEFTNMGSAPIDMTGWYWTDSTSSNPQVPITGIGVVQPGESVLYTEADPAAFRAAWGLPSTVQIWGPNAIDNLGATDAIKIFNGGPGVGVLVDQLSYSGAPATSNKSATIPVADLALTTNSSSWPLASVGDIYGSWQNSAGDIGNPGQYYAAVVPEPSSLIALLSGFAGLSGLVVKRKK